MGVVVFCSFVFVVGVVSAGYTDWCVRWCVTSLWFGFLWLLSLFAVILCLGRGRCCVAVYSLLAR